MARRRRGTADVWAARVGPAGWAVVTQHTQHPLGGLGALPAEQVLVNVRADESGRLRVWELYLFPADAPVTAERLRAVRVSAIEDMLNLPEERAMVEERRGEPVEPRELFNPKSRAYRSPLHRVVKRPETPATLAAPKGGGYGDDFYGRVADVYRRAIREDRPPVEAVRREASVPRSTAARWVKEARRRGLLPPAPAPGKKGA